MSKRTIFVFFLVILSNKMLVLLCAVNVPIEKHKNLVVDCPGYRSPTSDTFGAPASK